MIAQAEVFEAHRPGCLGHLAEGVGSIAGRGMVVEHPLEVRRLDEARQAAAAREVEPVRIVAQFRELPRPRRWAW